jgi:hypothetical protein
MRSVVTRRGLDVKALGRYLHRTRGDGSYAGNRCPVRGDLASAGCDRGWFGAILGTAAVHDGAAP